MQHFILFFKKFICIFSLNLLLSEIIGENHFLDHFSKFWWFFGGQTVEFSKNSIFFANLVWSHISSYKIGAPEIWAFWQKITLYSQPLAKKNVTITVFLLVHLYWLWLVSSPLFFLKLDEDNVAEDNDRADPCLLNDVSLPYPDST